MKLKQKKLKKSSPSSYPDEKNPFENEENDFPRKDHKSKHKKLFKGGKKAKTVEEKRGRALSKVITDKNEEQVKLVKPYKKVESQQLKQPQTQPLCLQPNIPSYLRTSTSNNNITKSSPNTETARCRKKPSEGDIKTLHKDSRVNSYGKNNPFESDIAEDHQETEENFTKNGPQQQADPHVAKKTTHVTRIHRTGSIVASSRERSRKKRKHKLKGFKKKKKGEKIIVTRENGKF